MISLQKAKQGFIVTDATGVAFCPSFAEAVTTFSQACGESLAYRPFELPSYDVTCSYTFKADNHVQNR